MSAIGLAARPARSAPGKSQNLPPNQTLYLNNLDDKTHKNDMIRSLYLLFSPQAHILDIIVMKTRKTRGQAHVVFKDHFAATQAMRSLQGVDFLGKPMRIQYAKGKSDIVAALDGSAGVVAAAKHSVAPAATANNNATDLQKQVFGGPSANAQVPPANGPVLGVPDGLAKAPSPAGIKRPREDESDDEGAPMEEDEDEDGDAMDVSDEG